METSFVVSMGTRPGETVVVPASVLLMHVLAADASDDFNVQSARMPADPGPTCLRLFPMICTLGWGCRRCDCRRKGVTGSTCGEKSD